MILLEIVFLLYFYYENKSSKSLNPGVPVTSMLIQIKHLDIQINTAFVKEGVALRTSVNSSMVR